MENRKNSRVRVYLFPVFIITRKMEHNIQYRIAGFELTQFIPSWEGVGNGKEFNMNNGIDFSYNQQNNIIKCTQNIDLLHDTQTVLKIQLCTYVEIEPNSVKSLVKDRKIVIPANFLAQCASFGHGALRGIMYLKTINTPLDGVILPPVVYSDVFKKPLTFEVVE